MLNHHVSIRASGGLRAAVDDIVPVSALLFGLIGGLLLPIAAPAQQALEEIIVTAERRAQSLQDIPIAATVFNAEDLANKGIDRIDDIQQFVPSVAINTYNRSTFINIRGVGLAVSAPAAAPGVAYYIDGVYVPKEQHIAHTFFDIESMEVLRGPQGTLTGQNSTGGAIYARSPAPDFESVSGFIDQTVASDDWYRTNAALNLPIGDTLALRVGGAYESRGSFTKNIGPSPSEPGSGEFMGVRAKLAWRPTDALQLNLGVDYFDNDTDFNPIKNRNDTVTSDAFVIEEDAVSFFDQEGFRASGELLWDITDNVRFRSITSYQYADQVDQSDGDRTATALPIPAGLPASTANRNLYPGRVANAANEFEYVISEANLLSTGEGPLQWVIGAFYLHETIWTELYRDNHAVLDFRGVALADSTILTDSTSESFAAFGQINYHVTDAAELIAGVRYSDDEFKLRRDMITGPVPTGGWPNTNSTSGTEWTGRVGLNYFLSDNVMLYGTVTKGYKPGAVNLTPNYPDYAAETNIVYEAGFKNTLLDNRLRLNGAVFFSDYDDFQVLSLLAVGTGPALPTFQNGTKGQSFGAELELTYAYEQVAFNAGIGYLDAEFAKDVMLNNAITGTSQLVPDGQRMPFSPTVTLNAGIQYDFMLPNGMVLTPRFQISHLGEQYATPFPSAATTVPSRDIADVRVTLRPDESWRIEAFVSNVFDTTYIASQVQDSTSARGGIIYGPPLQFGARVSYTFD